MKKFLIFFFLFLLIFCKSSANNQDIIETDSVQIIVNGKKIEFDSPVLISNDTLLFPLRSLFDELSANSSNISWDAKSQAVTLMSDNSILKFFIGSDTAILNGTSFSILASPILYKNQTFIPLRLVTEFLDCKIAWDNLSKTVFIKTISDFNETEEILKKCNYAIKSASSVKMDIISEINYSKGFFSFGHSIYVDTAENTIYTKNMLDSNWKISAQNYISSNSNYHEELLPFCFSLDKIKSNENTYILAGFYPSKKGILNESSLFIDTLSLQLVKLTSKSDYQTQNVLYQYGVHI